jgi:hypothetical protein
MDNKLILQGLIYTSAKIIEQSTYLLTLQKQSCGDYHLGNLVGELKNNIDFVGKCKELFNYDEFRKIIYGTK